ncbi:aminotransferase [Basidiobolus meristosporus CBS 931.73]|uniref:Aminotransferase n=1 Tax=Basidiobolus meristosporus CBS 931.73 TaxID=1314790 RepID=A0A1Y1XTG4_9FUNG|nr:aminotransferase [Basidiobolus meristosporus CBS 931.73]|eukprot:ORX89018.1 aminotransferase [Basidiobolus meristosporus CBS 931.73]
MAAAEFKAVNLGQGFMNFPAQEFVKEGARSAILDDACNQYAPPRGRPRLRNALAKSYRKLFNRSLNPDSEILVTAGGNEGLLAVFMAYLNPGDEVILMEPAFDQYMPNITMTGAVPVFVPLKPRKESYRSKITPRTKIIVVNTPHNPIGKVFTREELEAIGRVASEHNLLIVSDEVYDRLVFDNAEHVPIATIPGLWERTLTVASAGKAFGVTGWRIGWVIGPEALVSPALATHTRIVFCVSSPMQEGIASAFEQAETNEFFSRQREEYLSRRNKLTSAFEAVKLPYTIPQGSYFLLVNAEKLAQKIPADYPFPDHIKARGKNYELCYFFTREIGVSCIPPTEFYCEQDRHLAESYVRFAFCKTDDILDEAAKRLLKVNEWLQ